MNIEELKEAVEYFHKNAITYNATSRVLMECATKVIEAAEVLPGKKPVNNQRIDVQRENEIYNNLLDEIIPIIAKDYERINNG